MTDADSQLQPGDLVRVKSGGPLMTVHNTYMPSDPKHGLMVNTVWMHENQQCEGRFAAVLLERYDD